MKLKTCYYCGTKYSEEENRCPLCGQTEIEPEEVEEEVVASAAPVFVDDDDDDDMEYEPENKKEFVRSERKQNIVSAVVCVILALVVIAGILFILSSVGVFGPKNPAKDPSLNLPVNQDPAATVLCTGLEVTPASVSFAANGATAKITAAAQPANCTEQVVYASSNEAVATIAADGTVTAVGEGSASITVTCGSQIKTVAVICSFESAPPVVPGNVDMSKLSISNPDFTLFSVGESTKVSVKGLPDGVDVKIEWESGNPDVATVVDGKITAVAKGTTKVYAIINGTKGPECIVRCSIKESSSEPVVDTGVKLSHTDVTLRTVGEVFTIRLSKDGVKLANVTWTSTKNDVCTVSATGVVTAVANGTAKVEGVFEGKTYSCIVRCVLN